MSWTGDVPEHWEIRRLGDSAERCINGTWGEEPDGVNDLACIRVADFDRKQWKVGLEKLTMRAVTPQERPRRLLKPGDLLLEKSGGGDNQLVGVVVLYDHDFNAVTSNFVGKLEVRDGYHPKYLTYLHATLYALEINKRSIKQTTGIQNIDAYAYLSESVAYPPFEEQAAIVRYLDDVDQRIRAYVSAKERLIALLEEERQAVIQQAVARGLEPNVRLKPSGVEWLGDVPEHWEVKKVTRLFSIGSGTTPPSESPEYYGGGIPWINTSELRESVVSSTKQTVTDKALQQIPALKIYPPESVAVAMYGATIGRLGILGIAATVNQACCVFVGHGEMEPRFWFYHLLSKRDDLTSMAYGGGQPNLNQEILRSIRVPTPPISEQVKILEHLDRVTSDIDAAMDRARRQIYLIEEYRTRLIADVVTGKLDVREFAGSAK